MWPFNKDKSVEAVKERHRHEISAERTRYGDLQRRVEKLKEQHREDLEKQRQDDNIVFRRRLAEIRRSNEARVEQLQQENYTLAIAIDKGKQDANEALEQTTAAHRNEMNDQMEAHRARLASLTIRHDNESSYLKRQIEELIEALLSKDVDLYKSTGFAANLLEMTDAKLKESFQRTKLLVDQLAVAVWETDWHLWPDHELRTLRGQYELREVKTAVVQDLVWCLLIHFVFAHPFRMFGDEGNALQAQWVEFSN